MSLLASIQGNKKHTGAYVALIMMVAGGFGTSVDLLLELGKLRAMETYYELSLTKLTEDLYECEND